VASQGLRASLIWASWAAKSWNNWFLLFAKANQILIIIYMDFLVYIIFYFEYILHITKTNVGHVILNIWKEGITSTVQLVQIQVHVHFLLFTDCTDVTCAAYQNFWFGVANEVSKYADMSSAKGSKADSGAKKRLRKKKTLELIKSLDGSLYKHFITRDHSRRRRLQLQVCLFNPSGESIVDAHDGAADQSSLVCSGGRRRADYVDADMESGSDRAIHFKETGFSTSLAAANDLAEELEKSPDDMVIAAEGSIRRR